jgi:TRAP-type C4-dicarboxylate transport system substrate-binding protein
MRHHVGDRRAWMLRTAAMLTSAPAAWNARGQTALDLATAYPAGNFHVQNLSQLAGEVAAASAGRLAIRVHAGGSLVKAGDVRGAVQSGKVALGEVFGPSLTALNAVFALDAVPFLATRYDSALKLWSTVQARAVSVLEQHGLVLLMSVPWPPQGLFSARPLVHAADLEGLRMRENSPPVKRLAELAGMQPVRVETPDLAAAAAARQIDLVFTSAAQGLDTRLYENLPYYYEANAWLPRNLVFMNRAAHQVLAPQLRELLFKSTRQAEERGWQASAQYARSTTEQLIKSPGVKHGPLTPTVKARLERLGNRIGSETLRAGGVELLALTGEFLR